MDPRTYFYFYFPAKAAAQRLAEQLGGRGFDVDVRLASDEKHWLALARKVMSADELDGYEQEFEQLGRSLGGDYDGFERPVRSS